MIDIHNCTRDRLHAEMQKFTSRASEILMSIGIPKRPADGISMSLCTLMSGKDRHYHSISHVNHLFDISTRENAQLTKGMRLAVLFHDAIYVPGWSDCERASVRLMRNYVSGHEISEVAIRDASDMIAATARHLEEVEDAKTHLMLDLDLAPFAEDAEDVLLQNTLIEREILARCEDLGKEYEPIKRLNFLKKLEERPFLFYVTKHLEEKARTNLRMEIERVEKTV